MSQTFDDAMNSKLSMKAFAFPDLLLAVAGLALLGAVAAPMLVKNRAAGQRVTCVANLKQVTGAVLKYANEHGDALPAETTRRGGIWWWYKEDVKGYLGLTGASSKSDKVFACPGDRGYDDPGPFWSNSKFDFGSYNFNGVNIPGVPNIAGRAVGSIKDPHLTLLMMEWTAHGPLSWHNSRTGRKNAPFYDGAESVVGFVDGHVDFIKIHYDGINPAYTRDPAPGYRYKYSGD
jgi:hypothetical protein